MKKRSLWLIFQLLVIPTVNASVKGDIEQQWRVANNINDESVKVTIQTADFNDDGALDYAVYSSYFCGSQGCIYDIYSNINGQYCQVGKYDSDIALFKHPGEFKKCSEEFFMEGTSDLLTTPQEDLVSVKFEQVYLYNQIPIPTIWIQAKTDSVVLEGITINRGNCAVMEKALDGRKVTYFPKEIKFGQKHQIAITCPIDDVLEITVETNLGSESFSVSN
ncbi:MULTISPECIES: hypothetical protein [Vibrio harveyi group]|uniref:hypothetical protein n=1 Tax=Vibrio harveyi group TaxID=717610 RepID=UPI000CE402EE|nr:hypothetical protein [Vibrio jasicida]